TARAASPPGECASSSPGCRRIRSRRRARTSWRSVARMRRAVGGAVVAAVVVTLLAGCAPSSLPDPAAPTSSPAPSPTPSPAADPVVAAVAEMTTAERAASVVMGHVPTTDPAVLREFMRSGPEGAPLGGFILMGANVDGDAAGLRALTGALVVDPALPPLIAIDQEDRKSVV